MALNIRGSLPIDSSVYISDCDLFSTKAIYMGQRYGYITTSMFFKIDLLRSNFTIYKSRFVVDGRAGGGECTTVNFGGYLTLDLNSTLTFDTCFVSSDCAGHSWGIGFDEGIPCVTTLMRGSKLNFINNTMFVSDVSGGDTENLQFVQTTISGYSELNVINNQMSCSPRVIMENSNIEFNGHLTLTGGGMMKVQFSSFYIYANPNQGSRKGVLTGKVVAFSWLVATRSTVFSCPSRIPQGGLTQ
jgi:hypothetical protein